MRLGGDTGGARVVVDLDETHHAVHPGAGAAVERRADEADHQIRLSLMDGGADDFDDGADLRWVIAFDVEDAAEDEIRLRADVAVRSRVGGLEGVAQKRARVERAV